MSEFWWCSDWNNKYLKLARFKAEAQSIISFPVQESQKWVMIIVIQVKYKAKSLLSFYLYYLTELEKIQNLINQYGMNEAKK